MVLDGCRFFKPTRCLERNLNDIELHKVILISSILFHAVSWQNHEYRGEDDFSILLVGIWTRSQYIIRMRVAMGGLLASSYKKLKKVS